MAISFYLTITFLFLIISGWGYYAYRKTKEYPEGNVLIYGAGRAGKVLAVRIKEKCKFKSWDFGKSELIGFVDDNLHLPKEIILDNPASDEKYVIPILGTFSDLESVINAHKITSIFVAIGNPDSNPKHLKDIVKTCKQKKVHCFQFGFSFSKIA